MLEVQTDEVETYEEQVKRQDQVLDESDDMYVYAAIKSVSIALSRDFSGDFLSTNCMAISGETDCTFGITGAYGFNNLVIDGVGDILLGFRVSYLKVPVDEQVDITDIETDIRLWRKSRFE